MNTHHSILLLGAAVILSLGSLTVASAYPVYYTRGYHHHHHGGRVVIVNPAPVYAYQPYYYHHYRAYGYPYWNNAMIVRGHLF